MSSYCPGDKGGGTLMIIDVKNVLEKYKKTLKVVKKRGKIKKTFKNVE